jgi:hypothetical protein
MKQSNSICALHPLKVSLFFALSLLSMPALADSNWERLKTLYEESLTSASASDFSTYNFDTGVSAFRRQCYYFGNSGNFDFYALEVGEYTRVTPGVGPLVPSETVVKLYFGTQSSSANRSFDQTESAVVGQDLIITNPSFSNRMSAETGRLSDVEAKVFARKSGDYVPFKLVITYQSENPNTYYGYCYPN